MLERIKFESFWLGSPAFADVFVGREALQGLQPTSVVVGVNEVGKVCFELIVSIVMVALDGRFLDRAVHALDLAVGPWVLGLGRAVLDVVPGAGVFEGVSAEELAIGDCLLDQWNGGPSAAGGW